MISKFMYNFEFIKKSMNMQYDLTKLTIPKFDGVVIESVCGDKRATRDALEHLRLSNNEVYHGRWTVVAEIPKNKVIACIFCRNAKTVQDLWPARYIGWCDCVDNDYDLHAGRKSYGSVINRRQKIPDGWKVDE